MICLNCSEDFYTSNNWKKYCPSCFKKVFNKVGCRLCGSEFWSNRQKPKFFCSDCSSEVPLIIDQLEFKVERLEYELEFKENPFSQSRVIEMIRLCHPDLHQGPLAQLAHDTTCWLLELRERQQEGQAA